MGMRVLSRKPSEYVNGYDAAGKLLGKVMLISSRKEGSRIGFDFPRECVIVRNELDTNVQLKPLEVASDKHQG